ncbi:cytochrome C oxidase subunit IV [Paenibacillaceae bacterium]|nr:cytochrome C oxidase subunit IV [Paenibacillaceae bacterium]
MAGNHASVEEKGRRHKVEGPGTHFVAYIFSLLLTLIAFTMVGAGEVNTSFTYILLVVMAMLQVYIQMAFWMHMKDRGHVFPIVFVLTGVFIVFTCVIMAEYWVWW